MVDIKRVTASIKKPILFKNLTNSLYSDTIDLDPTDNPSDPTPENVTYTIDPFSIFSQETYNGSGPYLIVKVPFTRFYRIKYALTPNQLEYTPAPAGLGNNGVDAFTLSKPVLSYNLPLEILRISNGVTTNLTQNFYSQDGSAYMTFDPIINSDVHPTEPYKVTGYNQSTTFSPGIIEGISQLYAGDLLLFRFTLNVFKFTTQYQTRTVITGSPYATLTWFQEYPIKMYYWPNVWKCGSSFFFEIQELTDL